MTNPMTSPFQERPQPRVNRMTWDGTLEGARALDEMCRNSTLLARFQFNGVGQPCQVLVEPATHDPLNVSSQWVWVQVGDAVFRLRQDDDDSPLRVWHKPTVEQAAAVFTPPQEEL
jgi:hypothetical protein